MGHTPDAIATEIKNNIFKYQDNVDFWIIVHGALLDEAPLHSDKRHIRRERKKLIRKIRRNAIMVQKLQKKLDSLTRSYLKFHKQEGWE